jgi:hypothetical protein
MRNIRRALPFAAIFLAATLSGAPAAERDSSHHLLQASPVSFVEQALQSLAAKVDAKIEGVQKLFVHRDRCHNFAPIRFLHGFWKPNHNNPD